MMSKCCQGVWMMPTSSLVFMYMPSSVTEISTGGWMGSDVFVAFWRTVNCCFREKVKVYHCHPQRCIIVIHSRFHLRPYRSIFSCLLILGSWPAGRILWWDITLCWNQTSDDCTCCSVSYTNTVGCTILRLCCFSYVGGHVVHIACESWIHHIFFLSAVFHSHWNFPEYTLIHRTVCERMFLLSSTLWLF
jgi:hypothetical protein